MGSKPKSHTVDRPDIVERSKRAFELRAKGLTERAAAEVMAAEMGNPKYSGSQVHKDVVRAVNLIRVELTPSIEQYRALEVERLNQLQQALAPKVARGEVAAIATSAKISERLCKMLGLDAPTELKISQAVETEVEGQFDLFFRAIANDPELPASSKARVLAIAGNLQGRAALAGSN